MESRIIVVERVLNAPVDKVWKALTDRDEMKEWYFKLESFKPEKGFRFQFTGGPSPEKQYLHLCEVTEAVTGKKLAYSWRYDGYPGISYVTFELFAEGENTRLRLTHTGLDSFPADNPDFASHNFSEGWNMIINTNLKNYLEKQPGN